MNAKEYRLAHAGKLMVIRREECAPLQAADFFDFDSVETHPAGLVVTGIFRNSRRDHIMASRVREANETEIAWEKEQGKVAGLN